MNPQVIYHALSTLLSLAVACSLFFWGYRRYRVDHFRQQVFELRDRLFDDADAGLIEFDNRAYGMLRTMMNGYIRFGHRLNLWFILFTALFTWGLRPAETQIEREWAEATNTLDPNIRDRLCVYRDKLGTLAVTHALLASPGLCIILVLLALFAMLFLSVKHIVGREKAIDAEPSLPAAPRDSIQAPLLSARANVVKTMDDTAWMYGEPQLAT